MVMSVRANTTVDGDKAWIVFNNIIASKTTQELTDGYNSIAKDYEKISMATRYRGHIKITETLSEVEPNKEICILDVGCGTGQVGDKLYAAGYTNLYGVDLSEELLQIAQEKTFYTKLIHANFGPKHPLSFEKGHFDVMVAAACFIPNHLNETHLPEMIRLTKTDGYLIFATRKTFFEEETGDMKLKSGLRGLVGKGILEKIRHEDFVYAKDGDVKGVMLCYRVLCNTRDGTSA